jgi:mono/diheme cytochrome c family protein
MDQVVDLEGHQQFQKLNVQLVSVSIDSVPTLTKAVTEFGVKSTPHLSDLDSNVSRRYGILRWAMPNGEPGHTFVLVGKDGKVKWVRDYGAPENGGLMYVFPDVIYQEVVKRLPPSSQGRSILLERGEQLYTTNCQSCHGGATGGSMMDIPPPHNANGHTWHHPDCQLKGVIFNGSDEMGEMMRRMMGVPDDVPRMPAWKGVLSEEDVDAILLHIKTWWTEEQRRFQQQRTIQAC